LLDITEISAVVAAAGVLIGVVYYILDMRNQNRQRQTDMVMRLYATFGSAEFQRAYQKVRSLEFKDYSDYMKKYGQDLQVREEMYTVTIFFEGIGLLAKKRLIEMELVDCLFGYPIRVTWEKVASVVKGLREVEKTPGICEWFEYLCNEMKKREQKLQQLN
jgi:hypothetical protein